VAVDSRRLRPGDLFVAVSGGEAFLDDARARGAAATLERIGRVPEIIIHGDADPTVNVAGSRAMVAKLKELGTEFRYIEVPGGVPSDVVAPNLAAAIEFFDAHRKGVKSTSQQ